VQVGGQLACTEGSTEGPSAPEDLQASLLLGTFPDATFKQFHLSAGMYEIMRVLVFFFFQTHIMRRNLVLPLMYFTSFFPFFFYNDFFRALLSVHLTVACVH
jgi:hypothetical protein